MAELGSAIQRRHTAIDRSSRAVRQRGQAAYVGRLLRTHVGKHDVELHDYVDVGIPVLDRMRAKRLPAYATLGFDIPNKRPRATAPLCACPSAGMTSMSADDETIDEIIERVTIDAYGDERYSPFAQAFEEEIDFPLDVVFVTDTLTSFDLAEARLSLESETGLAINQFVLPSDSDRLAELRDGSVLVFRRRP